MSDIRMTISKRLDEYKSEEKMNEEEEERIDEAEKTLEEEFVASECQSKVATGDCLESSTFDEDSCESESTCTILEQSVRNQPDSPSNSSCDNQILSVTNLDLTNLDEPKSEFNYQDTRTNILEDDTVVEIELDENYQEEIVDKQELSPPSGASLTGSKMFTTYNHERPVSAQEIRGFSESEPKLTFSSHRMKEYFESLKSHSGETVRLYQFFKSTRTELVACLLFTLITSQALITSRSHFRDGSAFTWPLLIGQHQEQAGKEASEGHQHATLHQLAANSRWETSNRVGVHLAAGLVMSFTVASLTQVFGHVSGCHLIPSVSLALFIKGHISRARLVSYLAAQSIGPLLGVSLLSLLTSSQITPEEYREILVSRSLVKYAPPTMGEQLSGGLIKDRLERRRKREVVDDLADINLNDIQGSETILLSIVEQQEHQLQRQQQQQQQQQHGRSQEFDKRAFHEQRTITTNVSTYQEAPARSSFNISHQAEKEPKKELKKELEATIRSSRVEAHKSRPEGATTLEQSSATSPPTNLSGTFQGSFSSDLHLDNELNRKLKGTTRSANQKGSLNDKSRVFKHATGITTSQPSTTFEVPHVFLGDVERRQAIPLESSMSNASRNSKEEPQMGVKSSDGRLKLRRKKRNRQQQQQQQQQLQQSNFSVAQAGNLSVFYASTGSKHYINLLSFALPDSIMSWDSIKQCVEKQQTVNIEPPDVMIEGQANPTSYSFLALDQMAGKSFDRCLSVSNSSQMFIFQLVATLLIVLTYLINVDPRRVDLGFKSLSIGLSYFVASALTIQSGGFFGNPFHLLFLNWLTPSSEWQVEWFIYLVTPFIGGLFGAISHEYIDFTSMRNRDKQLKLRRSFYSLDNLEQAMGNKGNSASSRNRSVVDSHEAMEISTLNMGAEPRRARKVSSSSSLDSAAGPPSSLLTSAEDHYLNFQQQQQQQRNNFNQLVAPETVASTNNRKLASYSRQVKLEQRRLQANGLNSVTTAPTSKHSRPATREHCRRYDSNFLISSSPTPNSRQINTSGLM